MTAADSRPVHSRQTTPHPALRRLLERRRRQNFLRPINPRSRATFEQLDHWWRNQDSPLILDAGCGTGASSVALAQRHPDHAVIGIDKSAHRLNRQPSERRLPENCRLAQADLTDIWRLATAAGWQPAHHYLLYPNPWPKPKHLARRWHAHAVLPWLLALGGTLELRTNWDIYAAEFAAAIGMLLERPLSAHRLTTERPLTPFEHKYAASGHDLWRCRVSLSPAERHKWLLATNQTATYNQLVTTSAPGKTTPNPLAAT